MGLEKDFEQLAEDRPINMRNFTEKGISGSLANNLEILRKVRRLSKSLGEYQGELDDEIGAIERDLHGLMEEETLHTIFKRIDSEVGQYVGLRQFARLLNRPVVVGELSLVPDDQKTRVIDRLKFQVARRIAGTIAVIAEVKPEDERYAKFNEHIHAHVLSIIEDEIAKAI